MYYLVRLGLFGQVGRFATLDGAKLPRGSRVVCRTSRGLEVGEVLAAEEVTAAKGDPRTSREADGELVRRVTVQDDLLLARLARDKTRAIERCAALLEQSGSPAVLLDAEILLDGGGVFFYFLGDVPHEVAELTSTLAAAYQQEVRFERFAETLSAGCGPDCGTEAATGCGEACGSCAVAAACKAPH